VSRRDWVLAFALAAVEVVVLVAWELTERYWRQATNTQLADELGATLEAESERLEAVARAEEERLGAPLSVACGAGSHGLCLPIPLISDCLCPCHNPGRVVVDLPAPVDEEAGLAGTGISYVCRKDNHASCTGSRGLLGPCSCACHAAEGPPAPWASLACRTGVHERCLNTGGSRVAPCSCACHSQGV
jgi:hypothetical protein